MPPAFFRSTEKDTQTMAAHYKHLGIYSDWVSAAPAMRPQSPLAHPGKETQKKILEAMGFSIGDETPQDVRLERQWEKDGVLGEEISWSVGYGPRTRAWLLKPAGATGRLPGIVALHDHGAFKYFGKEKIAEGPDEPEPILKVHRQRYYADRPYPNVLAREGFIVLVADAFLWSSRRMPLETIPEETRQIAATFQQWGFQPEYPQPEVVGNTAPCWAQLSPAWSVTRTVWRPTTWPAARRSTRLTSVASGCPEEAAGPPCWEPPATGFPPPSW
jgi:hypothetical protein